MTNVWPLLQQEYFEDYVPGGGSAVKIICADNQIKANLLEQTMQRARDLSFTCTFTDAATTRVHLVQNLLFSIAKQLDWKQFAKRHSTDVLTGMTLSIPDDETNLSIARLARANDLEPFQLNILLQKRLREVVLKSPDYSRAFKAALLALLSASIDTRGLEAEKADHVIRWLCGEGPNWQTLREANITRRITRQNARSLLMDTLRWVRNCGKTNIIVLVDISQYSRNDYTGVTLNRYTPSAALDLFEMIRQFIDSIESVFGVLFIFVTTGSFLTEKRRGVDAYTALKMRLIDDVYDSARPNVMAPLIVIR